jgi:hypothetical protein
MAWSIDRLGRSLSDLVGGLQELHAARIDLFLHQQAVNTTTPPRLAPVGGRISCPLPWASLPSQRRVAKVNKHMESNESKGRGKGRKEESKNAPAIRAPAIRVPAIPGAAVPAPTRAPAIHVPDAAVLPPNAVVDSVDRNHTHSRNLSLSHQQGLVERFRVASDPLMINQ